MIYECWEGESEVSFFPFDTKQRDINTHDVFGNPLKLTYAIEASSWDEAMAEHHKRQGWQPYQPIP